MAHQCPECGMTCHCGGDIDDICFSGTKEEFGCTHCEDDSMDGEEDGYWPCPECGMDDGDHLDGCEYKYGKLKKYTEP